MATINQDLDKDAIEIIAAEYGVEVEEEIQVDKLILKYISQKMHEEELIETTSCCYNHGTC